MKQIKNHFFFKINIGKYFVILTLLIISLMLFSSCSNKKDDVNAEDTTKTTHNEQHTLQNTTTTHTKTTTGNEYNYSNYVPLSEPVDNTYFDDAIFIGDSRTEGFMLYTGLSNATFYTHKGLMVNTVFTSPVINLNGNKVSVMDAVKNNRKFNKVYIMLGINELGWSYSNLFVEKYSNIIDEILKTNANSKIYIQSIIPVTALKSSSDKVYNNAKIKEYNNLLQKLAKDKGVYFLNVSEALIDSSGCIPEEAAYDGIHLKKPYCEKWLEYLKTHTVK